jgi:hypothetical protein
MKEVQVVSSRDNGCDDGDDYRSPTVTRLGTLAELTKGGTVGPDDGLGGAGDEGSL